MRLYKANLTVINSRYGDLEKRVIEIFARHPNASVVELPGSLDILLMYLIQDGLIVRGGSGSSVSFNNITLSEVPYILTPKGREFITRWADAASALD